MKEKKQNIFERIKNWWKDLAPEDRAFIKGSLIGGASAATGAVITSNYVQKKQDDIRDRVTEDLCDEAYHRGLKDGEMNGYYNLLVNTDHAFKKMGMEPKHF